jgi:hypothetical protein
MDGNLRCPERASSPLPRSSLAVAFVSAAASAKTGQGGMTVHGPRTDISRGNTGSSFHSSGIKIGVEPRIKKRSWPARPLSPRAGDE